MNLNIYTAEELVNVFEPKNDRESMLLNHLENLLASEDRMIDELNYDIGVLNNDLDKAIEKIDSLEIDIMEADKETINLKEALKEHDPDNELLE